MNIKIWQNAIDALEEALKEDDSSKRALRVTISAMKRRIPKAPVEAWGCPQCGRALKLYDTRCAECDQVIDWQTEIVRNKLLKENVGND